MRPLKRQWNFPPATLHDRFLPDKALDLIDETAAYFKSINSKSRNLTRGQKN